MRINSEIRNPKSEIDAFSLLECLAYLAVFFVIIGVALTTYYKMDEQSRGFTRNSADIIRAVQAGERWREDVRRATNVVLVQAERELRLGTPGGDVSYFFRDGAVWRQGTNDKLSVSFLSDVKSSTMQLDARTQVKAWRWEVELKSKRTNATVRPLFTFVAVPREAAR